MVVDETSRKLIYNATTEDDILNLNVTSESTNLGENVRDKDRSANWGTPQDVEQIEHRRETNPEMDALYILSPMTHIVDCLMADFERKRYRKARLVWTSGQYFRRRSNAPALTSLRSPRSPTTSSAGTISNGARTDRGVSGYEHQFLSQRIARGDFSGSLELSGLVPPRL